MNVKIGVIGATGNVGRKVVSMIMNKKLAANHDLSLFASPRSAGQLINIDGFNFKIHNAEEEGFENYDICIFNTESDVSEKLVPVALQAGAYVVDSSSKYRLDPNVPLIIPPVNKDKIDLENKLYAHANCLASPIATVLGPLHAFNPLARVNAITYQSTSGAGKIALDDCWNETRSLIQGENYSRQFFKKQIAFNVIPQVGDIMDDGMTFEEYKIIHEVKKVIDADIAMTATAVRVPVMIGHSIALNIELSKSFELKDIIEILKRSPYVLLHGKDYMTPVEVVGSDIVFVGRIRRDSSIQNGLHLWLCSDNLRRGAATDSVEIVEQIIERLKNHGKNS